MVLSVVVLATSLLTGRATVTEVTLFAIGFSAMVGSVLVDVSREIGTDTEPEGALEASEI